MWLWAQCAAHLGHTVAAHNRVHPDAVSAIAVPQHRDECLNLGAGRVVRIPAAGPDQLRAGPGSAPRWLHRTEMTTGADCGRVSTPAAPTAPAAGRLTPGRGRQRPSPRCRRRCYLPTVCWRQRGTACCTAQRTCVQCGGILGRQLAAAEEVNPSELRLGGDSLVGHPDQSEHRLLFRPSPDGGAAHCIRLRRGAVVGVGGQCLGALRASELTTASASDSLPSRSHPKMIWRPLHRSERTNRTMSASTSHRSGKRRGGWWRYVLSSHRSSIACRACRARPQRSHCAPDGPNAPVRRHGCPSRSGSRPCRA